MMMAPISESVTINHWFLILIWSYGLFMLQFHRAIVAILLTGYFLAAAVNAKGAEEQPSPGVTEPAVLAGEVNPVGDATNLPKPTTVITTTQPAKRSELRQPLRPFRPSKSLEDSKENRMPVDI